MLASFTSRTYGGRMELIQPCRGLPHRAVTPLGYRFAVGSVSSCIRRFARSGSRHLRLLMGSAPHWLRYNELGQHRQMQAGLAKDRETIISAGTEREVAEATVRPIFLWASRCLNLAFHPYPINTVSAITLQIPNFLLRTKSVWISSSPRLRLRSCLSSRRLMTSHRALPVPLMPLSWRRIVTSQILQ